MPTFYLFLRGGENKDETQFGNKINNEKYFFFAHTKCSMTIKKNFFLCKIIYIKWQLLRWTPIYYLDQSGKLPLFFNLIHLFYFIEQKKKSACAEAIVLLFKNKKKKTFYADWWMIDWFYLSVNLFIFFNTHNGVAEAYTED